MEEKADQQGKEGEHELRLFVRTENQSWRSRFSGMQQRQTFYCRANVVALKSFLSASQHKSEFLLVPALRNANWKGHLYLIWMKLTFLVYITRVPLICKSLLEQTQRSTASTQLTYEQTGQTNQIDTTTN
jgi:hypothetical protein